jgi:hypothetical protein
MALDPKTLIFSEDFSGPLSSAKWKPNVGAGSFLGDTQQRPTLPVVVNGHAVLQLDTYNPTGLSYFGSEMISVPTFDVNTQGPLIFQATLTYEQAQKGMIGGFFTLGQGATGTSGHDEIDIELMSKYSTQFQTNVYHQAQYDSGNAISYSPDGFSQQVEHVYKFEWLPNGVVKWYVDDVAYRTVIATTPTPNSGLPGGPGTPDQPENLHFNIWVGYPDWPVSDPSMPLPTSNAGQNATFKLDVSAVSVWTGASMSGTAASEALAGTAGGEYIDGGAGNDAITGGGGDDVVEGGAGIDTAVYSGAARNYEMSVTAGVAVAVADRFGAEGVDILTHIESVKFADQTLDTSWLIKASNLGASSFMPIIDLYNAELHRAPDALGLAYWVARLSDGMSLTDIAKSFYSSAEGSALRPVTPSNAALVADAYASILDRAADAPGQAYWTGELQSGHLTPATFLLAFVQGVTGADVATLVSKETMGVYYAVTNGLTDTTHAKSVFVSDPLVSKNMTDGFAAAAASAGTAELVVKLVGVDLELFPSAT